MQAKSMLFYLLTFLFLMKCIDGRMTYYTIIPSTDAATLTCLKASGYLDEAFTQASYNDATHKWYSTTTPQSINAAGTIPHLILSIGDIQWQSAIVQNEAAYIARQFQNIKLKMIWLEPINDIYSNNHLTCKIVANLAKSITAKTKLQVGIFSNIDNWIMTFGGQKACPELSALPLFVFNSSKKIVPFGGWTSWDYQHVPIDRNACNKMLFQIRHT